MMQSSMRCVSSWKDPFTTRCGEDSLDVCLSNSRSWGYAIYLSESALYIMQIDFYYYYAGVHVYISSEKEIIIHKAGVSTK